MNLIQNTTELALYVCEKYIRKDGIAVDGTCGRGKDTLWLAERCRKVYSFDIQREALTSAEELLRENNIEFSYEDDDAAVMLINDSHEKIEEYVDLSPCIIMFNLGFLPGGNKEITTGLKSTMTALKTSLKILDTGGILCVTMYPGHKEGLKEKNAILKWAESLDKSIFHCVYADMLNQTYKAPQILWITKKKQII